MTGALTFFSESPQPLGRLARRIARSECYRGIGERTCVARARVPFPPRTLGTIRIPVRRQVHRSACPDQWLRFDADKRYSNVHRKSKIGFVSSSSLSPLKSSTHSRQYPHRKAPSTSPICKPPVRRNGFVPSRSPSSPHPRRAAWGIGGRTRHVRKAGGTSLPSRPNVTSRRRARRPAGARDAEVGKAPQSNPSRDCRKRERTRSHQ
jgi:hypothetical protein